jgi:hypothetical protein
MQARLRGNMYIIGPTPSGRPGQGLACSAGCCARCGNENQPCCSGSSCTGLADCVSGICRLHNRPACALCTDSSQCGLPAGLPPAEHKPVCDKGHCRVRWLLGKYYEITRPSYCPDEPKPWYECEGVRCGPGETCFDGKCRTCGYPGGECCDGPIFGGCYGDLICKSWNKCESDPAPAWPEPQKGSG